MKYALDILALQSMHKITWFQEYGYYHLQYIEGIWCRAIKEIKGKGKSAVIFDDNLCHE